MLCDNSFCVLTMIGLPALLQSNTVNIVPMSAGNDFPSLQRYIVLMLHLSARDRASIS